MEDWAEIRRLHFAERIPIKEIARQLGLARNTVREAIRSSAPPKYERKAMGSAVDRVEPEIRRLARARLRDERRELEAAGTEPEVEVRDLAVYDRLLGVTS